MAASDHSYIFIDWNFRIVEAVLSCRYSEEDGWFFAECTELRLIDQGESRTEAMNNLANMIIASLIDAITTGKIDEMLAELGFTKEKINIPNRNYYKQPATYDEGTNPLPVKSHFPLLKETSITA